MAEFGFQQRPESEVHVAKWILQRKAQALSSCGNLDISIEVFQDVTSGQILTELINELYTQFRH